MCVRVRACVCRVCVCCVDVCHILFECLWRSVEGVGIPGAGVTYNCEAPIWIMGTKLGPLDNIECP